MLSKLYSHGFPEHTDTTVIDSELLTPVNTIDDLTLSGHWQTSKVSIEISNIAQWFTEFNNSLYLFCRHAKER